MEQLIMFDRGITYSELYDCGDVDRKGRILCSRAFPKAVQTLVSTTLLWDHIFGTWSTVTNGTNMKMAGDCNIRDGVGGGGGIINVVVGRGGRPWRRG